MNKLKQTLEKILKQEESFLDTETKEINYNKVKDSADKIDKKLIAILAENRETKDKFFTKIKDVYVFNVNDFKFFLDENKIDNSYTRYANQIGLSSDTDLLKNNTDVVLDFPFKDCVLEGGQSTEEGTDKYFEYSDKSKNYEEKQSERKEVFFNQILAQDEIDRLFDRKALVNWKRYEKDSTKNGEPVKEIKRDKNGLIKENLIIKGNNLLALHSLKSEFAEKIKLIYIDPPYNTGGSMETFTYNNTFKHSTWLTFMKNRLEIAKELLSDTGFIAITIDHIELFYLGTLADEVFGRKNRIGIITIVNQARGRWMDKNFSASNEFMLVYSKEEGTNIRNVVIDEKKKEKFNLKDDKGNYYLKNYIVIQGGGGGVARKDKPNFWYPIFVSKDLKHVSLEKKNGYEEVLPITNSGKELTWITTPDTFIQRYGEGEVVLQREKGKIVVYRKFREQQIITTHWLDSRYNSTSHGTLLLEKITGRKDFSYPKSLYAVMDTLKLMTSDDDIILDFHAGSGTTGHATLELNKEDGGNRKFILVEQLDEHIKICVERNQKILKNEKINDSFIYFELAKWNEQAKEEINDAKDLKTLEKMFDSFYEKYFLNYNVKVKDFKEKVLKEENFKKLTLNDQKKMFLVMLDLNQMYVQESEIADKQFGINKEDQKLTKEFYQNK
ncbi:MAG: Type III restriction/modification system modification methylase [Candidatus Nomurabacteria bacterium GW2011_GWA2_43_15]|uniref:Type III restriction/modification system modification methylase n=1 Tax=Candidatus Nomurabacteria bacterium GW2011_GWA2_43_15 TaxID=1618738 RepID=A0A0G1DP18_9BACT|nr:MAG: Type III restriction/modification system modification methylase [Candidatus Nomurabacteria bacterium GW2011_GWA2_43_15]